MINHWKHLITLSGAVLSKLRRLNPAPHSLSSLVLTKWQKFSTSFLSSDTDRWAPFQTKDSGRLSSSSVSHFFPGFLKVFLKISDFLENRFDTKKHWWLSPTSRSAVLLLKLAQNTTYQTVYENFVSASMFSDTSVCSSAATDTTNSTHPGLGNVQSPEQTCSNLASPMGEETEGK